MTDTNQQGRGVPVAMRLLFGAAEPAVATTFLHDLNAATDESFVFAAGEASDDRFTLQGEAHHVVVERVDAPVDAEAFASALAHPFLPAVFPAAQPIVTGHRAHARIVVSGGEARDGDPAAVDATEIEMADFEPERMLPRLRLLRAAGAAYARQHFPLAVHWCQCDNLLAGPDFVQMAEREAETELFVKPVPFSEGDGAFGAVTWGASNLIGREVELAEAPMPAAWAADRLLQFVEQARTKPPAAGAALRFPDDEILLVHEVERCETFPGGRLRLTVEKLPGGAAEAPAPAIGFLADAEARAGRAFGRR